MGNHLFSACSCEPIITLVTPGRTHNHAIPNMFHRRLTSRFLAISGSPKAAFRPVTGIRAFTLVELLTVIAVMAIIGAFGTPALMTLLNGGAMNQTTLTVNGILEQPRQYAVA